jgi:hypothetical protein
LVRKDLRAIAASPSFVAPNDLPKTVNQGDARECYGQHNRNKLFSYHSANLLDVVSFGIGVIASILGAVNGNRKGNAVSIENWSSPYQV